MKSNECTKRSKCSVTGKISAIFNTIVTKEESNKRKGQNYKVVTTEKLKDEFIQSMKEGLLLPTVKIDGTSCLIEEFNGRPWLWARHDVKPNKIKAKHFQEYLSKVNAEKANGSDVANCDIKAFQWDVENDFKKPPEDWRSASGMVPSDNGHLVGWVPVDPSLRTHLWHLSVVDFENSCVLLGRYSTERNLTLSFIPMKELLGKTFELIGTNVNANPYKLGGKKTPFHILIQHGEIPIDTEFLEFSHKEFEEWFEGENGKHEGIVWHSHHGEKMFKIHRHHLRLQWPVDQSTLNTLEVKVSFGAANVNERNAMFARLKRYDGSAFDSLNDLAATETDVSL